MDDQDKAIKQAVESVGQGLSDEIDAGVEVAVQDAKAAPEQDSGMDVKEEDEKEGPQDEGQQEGSEGGEQGSEEEDTSSSDDGDGGDEAPDAISDELLERAVKAGLTVSEARQYPSAELLSSMCDRLDRAGSDDTSSEEDGAQADTAGDDDPLAAIPDLDPDEYDEKIVDGFKALKSLVKQQQDTINDLRSGQGTDWFASQVEGLGESVNKALEGAPEKRDALKAKFEMLTAGYKTAGQDADRANVFQEAASLVLGDELASAKEDATKAALSKRSGQHISRTSGRKPKPKGGDAFEDVAAELDGKFFNK